MKVYIAASWKHKHAVEMLTDMLRDKGHEVLSFIENSNEEGSADLPFEEWVETEKAEQSFQYDTQSAMDADVVIYVGPSGKDAAAECGIAYACCKPIIGLSGKGEDFGLMRKMFTWWVDDYREALATVESLANGVMAPAEGE
jgi:hypothetical protein